MFKGIVITVFTFLLMLTSCRKDELTLPANVFFEFELISYQETDNLKSGNDFGLSAGRINVNSGSLAIKSIAFDGRRDEGRDVFFISNLKKPLKVDLETGRSDRDLSFDIPQGIYNLVELYIELGNDDEVPLILEGRLRRGQIEDLPVRFEYNIREQIRVRAESGKQSDKIVLRRDTPSTARIIIDAGTLFQFVNMPALQNASISMHDGKNKIVISSDSNSGLFNSMANRLERSFRVIID